MDMLRSFISPITQSPLIKGFLRSSQRLSSVVPKRFQCSQRSKTVQEWIDSLTEDRRQRVKFIQNELTLKNVEKQRVPQLASLNIADYEEMLQMSSTRRQRHYDYLYATKTARTNNQLIKLLSARAFEEKKELGLINPPSNHIQYGLGKSAMILRVTNQEISKWRNAKCWRAMMANEPPLIYDCGFCSEMTKYEIRDTAKQLKYAFSANRIDRRPFVMNLCNLDKKSLLWHELLEKMPNIEKLPIKIHSNDVSEVFPTEKLVYLSPDAGDVMHDYEWDAQYVLGAIVDKGSKKPLMFAKAKKLNIRTVRLPIDKYLRFRSHKTLTLDQMMKIMLEIKRTKDWNMAFRHVPRRLIFG